jgi:hypothetical protein
MWMVGSCPDSHFRVKERQLFSRLSFKIALRAIARHIADYCQSGSGSTGLDPTQVISVLLLQSANR